MMSNEGAEAKPLSATNTSDRSAKAAQLADDIMDMKAELKQARKDRDRATEETQKILVELGTTQDIINSWEADKEHFKHIEAELRRYAQSLERIRFQQEPQVGGSTLLALHFELP